jgi:hypothetical protein
MILVDMNDEDFRQGKRLMTALPVVEPVEPYA